MFSNTEVKVDNRWLQLNDVVRWLTLGQDYRFREELLEALENPTPETVRVVRNGHCRNSEHVKYLNCPTTSPYLIDTVINQDAAKCRLRTNRFKKWNKLYWSIVTVNTLTWKIEIAGSYDFYFQTDKTAEGILEAERATAERYSNCSFRQATATSSDGHILDGEKCFKKQIKIWPDYIVADMLKALSKKLPRKTLERRALAAHREFKAAQK